MHVEQQKVGFMGGASQQMSYLGQALGFVVLSSAVQQMSLGQK
jgi:hypothetical protein